MAATTWQRTLDDAAATTGKGSEEECFRLWVRGTDELVLAARADGVDSFSYGCIRVYIRAGVDSVSVQLAVRKGKAGFKLETGLVQQYAEYAEPLSHAFQGSASAAFAIWDSAREQTTKDLYKDWVSSPACTNDCAIQNL